MRITTQNSYSQSSEKHLWYPFLQYIDQCIAAGKEVSINEWLISKGKISHFIEQERLKQEKARKEERENNDSSQEEEDVKRLNTKTIDSKS